MVDYIAPGKRVIVQFGKKKFYSAIVYQITHTPPQEYEAKYIHAILDDSPIVSEQQFRFWNWISSYYLCTLGDVMNAALPAPFKLESETLVMLNPDAELGSIALTDKEFLITEALTVATHLSISEISAILDVKNVFGVLKGLYTKGVIVYTEDIKEKYSKLKENERTKDKVKIAGRIMTIRDLGKLIFCTLQDSKAKIQVILQKDETDEKSFYLFKKYILNVVCKY